MNYEYIINDGINKENESTSLVGAISSDQYLFYSNTIKDRFGVESESDFDHITRFVPKSFYCCYDFFIGREGAVAGAYNLSCFSQKEQEEVIKFILNKKQEEYPDYNFDIVSGEFPVEVNGGLRTSRKTIRGARAVMSTHILYITDYQNHIKSGRTRTL